MRGHSFELFDLLFVGFLVATTIGVVGQLTMMEIRGIISVLRQKERRHRSGPRGVAVIVRGLGLRSENSVGHEVMSSMSTKWTERVQGFEDSESYPGQSVTIRGVRKGMGARVVMGRPDPSDLGRLGSAGRG